MLEIEAVTKQQDEKRYPNIEMNLIDDLDECLVKTGDMFADLEHKSMFTSPYFKNLFPQKVSIENYKLTANVQGYSVPLDTSGDLPIFIGRSPFQQTCSEIGGVTQTINLHMKCKWYSYDTTSDAHVEDLVVDFDSVPICISKWCDGNMLGKQLSVIFAKGFQLHFNQQVEFQNASCEISSDACILETKQIQNLNLVGTRLHSKITNPDPIPFVCNGKYRSDEHCIVETYDDQILCEKHGGQLIEHQINIYETKTKMTALKIRNYPHCVSRLCNLGRDKKDLEKLFTASLRTGIFSNYVGHTPLSVEIDDEEDLY